MIITGMEHFEQLCRNHTVIFGMRTGRRILMELIETAWAVKALQNYKAVLLPTDNLLAEYTYNGDRQELYEDMYELLAVKNYPPDYSMPEDKYHGKMLAEWYNSCQPVQISVESTFVVWKYAEHNAMLSTTVSGDGIYAYVSFDDFANKKTDCYTMKIYKKVSNRCIKED